MKKMKFAVCFNAVIIAALAVVLTCTMYRQIVVQKRFSELNKGFNGEFDFGVEVGQHASLTGFVRESGFGCYILRSSDDLTEYIMSGFPDTLDKYCVTYFETENPEYELWGINVGDNMSDAVASIEKHGYKFEQEFISAHIVCYNSGQITISIQGEETVTWMRIRLESTNIEGVIY